MPTSVNIVVSTPSVKPLVDGREHNQNRPLLKSIASSVADSVAKISCEDCYLNNQCVGTLIDNDDDHGKLKSIISHPKPIEKGTYVYRQKDTLSSIYIVRSGAVKTYFIDKMGEEHIIGFYMPGELFGMDGLISGQHHYSAKSLNTTSVCEISYHQFEREFYLYPNLHRHFLENLCSEIQERQQPLLLLQRKKGKHRLATFFLDISTKLGRRGCLTTEFILPMSRSDIADYLGLAIETISRLFSQFQQDQLITVEARTVKIIDMAALKKISISLD